MRGDVVLCMFLNFLSKVKDVLREELIAIVANIAVIFKTLDIYVYDANMHFGNTSKRRIRRYVMNIKNYTVQV